MNRFDYLEPTTLKKALALMEKHGEDGRVIAGGTSLLIMMRQRLLLPKTVISLARIPKLDRIRYNAKTGLSSRWSNPSHAMGTVILIRLQTVFNEKTFGWTLMHVNSEYVFGRCEGVSCFFHFERVSPVFLHALKTVVSK